MVTGPCQVCPVISCPRRLPLFLSFAAPATKDPPGHGIHHHIPDPGPLHVLNPHPEMLCFRCPQDHGISAQVKCHCLYTISSLLHHCISVCFLNQNVSSTKARNFLMLFETASHTVAQPGLELTMYARPASNFPAILLTQPPKRWNYRRTLARLAQGLFSTSCHGVYNPLPHFLLHHFQLFFLQILSKRKCLWNRSWEGGAAGISLRWRLVPGSGRSWPRRGCPWSHWCPWHRPGARNARSG